MTSISFDRYHFIAIEGNIGVGKTSLAKLLSKKFQSKIMLEDFERNIFLPSFYQKDKKLFFPLEFSFLIDRYKQLYSNLPVSSGLLISDYLFDKSSIFSQINLLPNESSIIRDALDTLKKTITAPDLIIFIETDLSTQFKNIAKRNREIERDISREYLMRIKEKFDEFLASDHGYRIIKLNLQNIDFVQNPLDLEKIYNLLSIEHPIGVTCIALK